MKPGVSRTVTTEQTNKGQVIEVSHKQTLTGQIENDHAGNTATYKEEHTERCQRSRTKMTRRCAT